MKLASVLIELGLALLLVLTAPALPWGQTPYQWNNQAIASQIYSSNVAASLSSCDDVATIIDDTLKIHYSPECLEEKLHLSQFLHQLETVIAEKTRNKLTVSNLNYALIDEGIHLEADIVVNIKPIPGTVPVSVAQDLSLSIKDGYLYVKAGKTDLESSKVVVQSNRGMIIQKISQKLSKFNGKKLDDFFALTQFNTLAESIGISTNAVDFMIQSTENNLSLNLDKSGLTLAIRFY